MPPATGYDPIGTVQQAIVALLDTNEPIFLAIGARLFTSFAAILIVACIRWMLGGPDGERLFGFARLLLIIAFGYTMIAFYESPIPGLGTSFSNLITDQTGYLASVISARSVQDAQQTLSSLWNALEQPDPGPSSRTSSLDHADRNRRRAVRRALRRLLPHDRLCRLRLLGPLFIPFFIVPTLGGCSGTGSRRSSARSCPSSPRIHLVFERFLSRALQTLPPGIRLEDQLLYGVHAVMILLTFTVGVLLVPSLTSSMFSGRSVSRFCRPRSW